MVEVLTWCKEKIGLGVTGGRLGMAEVLLWYKEKISPGVTENEASTSRMVKLMVV